jgi:polygalacturonase
MTLKKLTMTHLNCVLPRRASVLRAFRVSLILFALSVAGHLAAADFDVKHFGAKGDGKRFDTAAINRAIAAAHAAGGGTVRFPAGTYLSASIHLQSNVGLFLEPGCVIEAADHELKAYDAPEPNIWGDKNYQDFGHSHWHNSLIWGEGLENISICGGGRIYGKGLIKEDVQPPGSGDKTIALKNCRNVTLRDFTIFHGAHFGVLATGVDNMTIDNLNIDTDRDGMDIDCCHNVRISNCNVNSPYDDAICLKSSYALGCLRPTENVSIVNCHVSGFVEGTMLDGTRDPSDVAGSPLTARDGPCGRIKFGTESNGGFKNITIANCTFEHCRGLALEEVDGGDLEDVSICNLTMRDVSNAAIFLRLGNRARGPNNPPVGSLRRVNIDNVVASGVNFRCGAIISGIPGHDIEDISFSNIRLLSDGGGTKEDAAVRVPERETAYPDPGMFHVLPSYGFYLRHVNGVTLRNVAVGCAKPDLRPAFALDDVTNEDFDDIKPPVK